MKRCLNRDALSASSLVVSRINCNERLKISKNALKSPLFSLSFLPSSSIRPSQPQTSCRLIHTVVMVRHGESLWNQEKRFTGWCDVPLTHHGEADAKDAGLLMGERGMKFDIAFTSTLERAWRTCALVLSACGQSDVETIKSWRLNERHYGALQGHLKDSKRLLEAFGENKIIEWRRSYTTAPPSLVDPDFVRQVGIDYYEQSLLKINPHYLDDAMTSILNTHCLHNPSENLLLSSVHPEYPMTESLQQCEERAYGYWMRVIAPAVKQGKRVLIVAHANTIRALVKAVDKIADEDIAQLKIPNGIPLVYTLDHDLKPTEDLTDDIGFQANYLVSARNHGKMMAYERCVNKKLRSLFEFLDSDQDGRITSECLQSGMNRLLSDMNMYGDSTTICEYEVEELLRCIPRADESGGITLSQFLASVESGLIPRLTKLRLLQ